MNDNMQQLVALSRAARNAGFDSLAALVVMAPLTFDLCCRWWRICH
jgi:hypothetical protein